jgi:hypothetical protein
MSTSTASCPSRSSSTPVILDPEQPEPADAPAERVVAEHEDASAGSVVGSARLGQATVGSRYAGAMLLHAFFDRVGAQTVFAPLGTVNLAMIMIYFFFATPRCSSSSRADTTTGCGSKIRIDQL